MGSTAELATPSTITTRATTLGRCLGDIARWFRSFGGDSTRFFGFPTHGLNRSSGHQDSNLADGFWLIREPCGTYLSRNRNYFKTINENGSYSYIVLYNERQLLRNGFLPRIPQESGPKSGGP